MSILTAATFPLSLQTMMSPANLQGDDDGFDDDDWGAPAPAKSSSKNVSKAAAPASKALAPAAKPAADDDWDW